MILDQLVFWFLRENDSCTAYKPFDVHVMQLFSGNFTTQTIPHCFQMIPNLDNLKSEVIE